MKPVEITIAGAKYLFGSRSIDGAVSYFFESAEPMPAVDFGFTAEEIAAANPGPEPITAWGTAVGMVATAIMRAGKE